MRFGARGKVARCVTLTAQALSSGRPRSLPLGEAACAELAGRAGAAAIAPVMADAALAFLASGGLLDDELDEILAAKRVRQRPGLGLGPPHQRRVEGEGDFRAESDRLLKYAK